MSDARARGMARDVCGNYYVLGQTTPSRGNQIRLLRLDLDEAGDTLEREVELAEHGQLGNSGLKLRFAFGFNSDLDRSVFTSGNDAAVLVVDVGIEGAPEGPTARVSPQVSPLTSCPDPRSHAPSPSQS